MANGSDKTSCVVTCWGVAIVASIVLGALLMMLGDWRFIQAAFAAVIAAIVVGFLLGQFVCSESTAKADLQAVREGKKGAAAASAKAAAAVAAVATTTKSDAASLEPEETSGAGEPAASSEASKAFEMQPTKALAGEAELAARKGDWKYQGDEGDKAPSADAQTESADSGAAQSEDADAGAGKSKRPPVAADGQPELLAQARPEGADDLKLISGVGPKLEGTLNELGFWHFDQVAGWRKKEIEWVDSRLKFKGRIERDDWISQAKILAKGGETEFSKKKKK